VPDATPDVGSGRSDLTVGLTFGPADLAALCRLDELGLEVTGQRLESGRAVLACRVIPGRTAMSAGAATAAVRRAARQRGPAAAHEPFGWRPTTLLVTIRRYRCGDRPQLRATGSGLAAIGSAVPKPTVGGSADDVICAVLVVAKSAEMWHLRSLAADSFRPVP
jgi:hypothetical protein